MTHGNALNNADKRPFMQRLLRDSRGNTLVIVAASLLPLTGIIGSGVDAARGYMTKSRLQSACDAATLAARRAMSGDVMNDAVRDEGKKFFNFNFPVGIYGSRTITFRPETPPATPAENSLYIYRSGPGTVAGKVRTKLPTSVMHLFGFANMDLTVTCEASQQFTNTDIMLVLDTTGSMACSPALSASDCTTWASQAAQEYYYDGFRHVKENVDGSRMEALREAVLALYDELRPVQTELETAGMRLRYGVVPYSAGVNVGKLLVAKNASYVADSWTYQSRSPIYDTPQTTTYANKTNDECNNYRRARSPANSYPATETTVARPGSGTRRNCIATLHNFSREPSDTFSHWAYEPVVQGTAVFKTGVSTPVPTRTPGTTDNATWQGCIEERATTSSITGTYSGAIPSGAYDLNIDMVPTSDEDTKWKAYWPHVEYYPTGSRPQFACPAESRRLAAWQRGDLSSYLDGLRATGGTYHDNGMIWGSRLLSDAGAFADSPTSWQSMPVAKHLIFMTDGVLETGGGYSTYGVEGYDERVTGGNGSQNARHTKRFAMMCDAAKAKGYSVWVVGFTAASSDLQTCASNANQYVLATTTEVLVEKFRQIGRNIGALRLTQ